MFVSLDICRPVDICRPIVDICRPIDLRPNSLVVKQPYWQSGDTGSISVCVYMYIYIYREISSN